ncbi:hypothetical protein ABZ383_00295 [Streptomyces sp. NPDC005900]|uniref:hypothetical protein n=1 Tax=Streptomyces sp. NPDC005900 TaxID=3154569 RepID=UPI0033EF6A0D
MRRSAAPWASYGSAGWFRIGPVTTARRSAPCPLAPLLLRAQASLGRTRGLAESPANPDVTTLLEHVLPRSVEQTVFRTELSHDRHWVPAEHHMLGEAIVPGTIYMEMCRAASTPHPGSVSGDISLTR